MDRGAVALDLIGTVLPYTLHQDGAWCAHASAVTTADGVVAFLAARGTGKSTLATACMDRGAALVADDVVVLRQLAQGVSVTPSGLPLRVHVDTARAVGAVIGGAELWGKVRVAGVLARDDAPLAALYVLSPVEATARVARERRTTRAAALALLAHGKITALLGAAQSGDALARCVDIATRIPVYDLAVPRDLRRLHEVADAVLAWHDGGGDA
ncbi:MAG: hypothetical protein U5K74_15330 [Gemmatimonadaceae bacterium]|nr:hypothetical protein [Gemmatimonadaceae bacterium]